MHSKGDVCRRCRGRKVIRSAKTKKKVPCPACGGTGQGYRTK